MPEAPTPEVKEFLDALDSFMENPPRDLPDGTAEAIKSLGHNLRGYHGGAADNLSPGEREAAEQRAGGEGKISPGSADYRNAATGPDKPSPGQREYEAAIQAAAGQILSQGAPASSE